MGLLSGISGGLARGHSITRAAKYFLVLTRNTDTAGRAPVRLSVNARPLECTTRVGRAPFLSTARETGACGRLVFGIAHSPRGEGTISRLNDNRNRGVSRNCLISITLRARKYLEFRYSISSILQAAFCALLNREAFMDAA